MDGGERALVWRVSDKKALFFLPIRQRRWRCERWERTKRVQVVKSLSGAVVVSPASTTTDRHRHKKGRKEFPFSLSFLCLLLHFGLSSHQKMGEGRKGLAPDRWKKETEEAKFFVVLSISIFFGRRRRIFENSFYSERNAKKRNEATQHICQKWRLRNQPEGSGSPGIERASSIWQGECNIRWRMGRNDAWRMADEAWILNRPLPLNNLFTGRHRKKKVFSLTSLPTPPTPTPRPSKEIRPNRPGILSSLSLSLSLSLSVGQEKRKFVFIAGHVCVSLSASSSNSYFYYAVQPSSVKPSEAKNP